jgi:phosphatidylglycerol:prolipoprotein diacylglycerol transferase
MLEMFHNFAPSPVLWQLGLIKFYWYGLIMVLAMMAGLGLAGRLVKDLGLKSEILYDLMFWLIIWGLLGARLYHVGLEWAYYSRNLLEIVQVWHGGLAIHGAILAGLVTLVVWSRRQRQNVWLWAAVLAPGVALGQAIGRWGNYFNQELFGRPTTSLWGIWIDPWRRPVGYERFDYFQPTFLYESLCSLALTLILVLMIKKSGQVSKEALGQRVLAVYLIGFGMYRGLMELIKIDATPMLWGWRWPQIMSALLILSGVALLTVVGKYVKLNWKNQS